MSFIKNIFPKKLQYKHTGKRVIEKFVDSLGWIYLGPVDQRSDDHTVVRGMTASVRHFDTHYSVGTVANYPAILLQRIDTMKSPGHSSHHYRWVVLEITLRHTTDVHMVISGERHPEVFYRQFFIAFSRFRKLNDALSALVPSLPHTLAIFGTYDKVPQISELLIPLRHSLAEHLTHLEAEIHNNKLYIYSSSLHVTAHTLERMVKTGVWLARRLDK